jgi:hypothetical protein
VEPERGGGIRGSSELSLELALMGLF